MSNRTLSSFILAATALTSPLAFAADRSLSQPEGARAAANAPHGGLTRDQVVQEVLKARRNGTLLPAGERGAAKFSVPPVSTLSREDVLLETKSARLNGELQPAGEATVPVFAQVLGPSKTREQVKQETMAARMNGTLLPAGEAADARGVRHDRRDWR